MLKNNKGQSTVELALVLPILILILVGILEFGLVFKTSIQLNYGANELARAISLNASAAEVAELQTYVFSDLDSTNLNLSVLPNTAVKGQPITVTITYSYKWITPLINNLLGDQINLTGKSVIIKE